MNFLILKTNDSKKLMKIAKEKTSFLPKQDINIFHINKINNSMIHIVFHIPDEYHIGTKRGGSYLNVPFSQYVNTFLFKNSSYFLMEYIEENYIKELSNYIKKKTNADIFRVAMDNNLFNKLVSSLPGFIKQVEFIDENGDEQIIESLTIDKFHNYCIDNKYTLEYILLNVDQQFISMDKNGKISVDNSDEKYLIKFTEVIVNALGSN